MPDDYLDIKRRIKNLFRQLNTGNDDRSEEMICGWRVRVWRETSVNDLTEMLWKYKGNDYDCNGKRHLRGGSSDLEHVGSDRGSR